MTEAEWLACSSPTAMLNYLDNKASNRKLRLFACACCRRFWHLLTEELRKAVEVGENFADGLASAEELDAASGASGNGGAVEAATWTATKAQSSAAAMYAIAFDHRYPAPDMPEPTAAHHRAAAYKAARGAAEGSAIALAKAAMGSVSFVQLRRAFRPERREQAVLLRDIFGNPFRPVSLDPSWLNWNGGMVPKIAKAIYGERRSEDLHVLADALMNAGCGNEEILTHCRGHVSHARGCWVIDQVLGK
jgi:hypothetical protein